MEAMMNLMRRAAAEVDQSRARIKHGLITSYDPVNRAVVVELQPEGTLTGWLPLKAIWAGNGWGMFHAPAIGSHVEVHFQEGDRGVGSVGFTFSNDEDRPLPVPAEEFWLVHKNGQFIKVTNDGKLIASDGHGATLIFNGDGTLTSAATQWNHTGPITVTDGDITTNQDVIADGISLKTHTHGGVQAGSDDTGEPE